jgi:hypothetical protein
VEKASSYDAFCEKKMAQIPACMTTQEAIQRFEEKRLEAFLTRFSQHASSNKYTIPGPSSRNYPNLLPSTANSPTPTYNKENENTGPALNP